MWRRLQHSEVRRDLFLALGLTAFAALIYAEASRLPPPFFDPLGSAAVPKLVAVVLVVLGWAALLQRLAAPLGEDRSTRGAAGTALLSIVLPLAYVGAMQFGVLAFAQASTLFIIVMGGLFARFRRSAMLILVPLAFLVGFGLDHVFTRVLFIDLPQRSWLGL